MAENPPDDERVSDSPEDPPIEGDDRSAGEPLADDPAATDSTDDDVPTPEDVRDELYGERDDTGIQQPMEGFDEGIVDLLSWGLDTETRARIYVRLRQRPRATSEEVAEATGLYPSTVREALAALHDEEIVERRKRHGAGAGNDPYEYTAIAPSDLVGTLAERIQDELNAVFDLGRSPDRDATGPTTTSTTATEPVTITVRDADDAEDTHETDAEDIGDTNTEDTDETDDE